MKKRLMALLLLTGLLSAALTGCGGGSTEQASEDGQTADGSTEARAQANEIVVGIAQDLDESLDPHLAVAAGTKEVMFNVFEGLVKPTPDGDLVPAVADHYEISEDQTTYTFTLREGVQFHNGDPVEMRDVTYSIERCADDSEGQRVFILSDSGHPAGGLYGPGHRPGGHGAFQIRLPDSPGLHRSGAV